MNYIIFDLEFNQKYHQDKTIKDNTSEELSLEIIQIGAQKLNAKLETLSTYNAFVKPTVHLTLNPYVQSLTNITNEIISSSRLFPAVYKEFLDFIGDSESILCVWGICDIKELIKNIKFHNLSYVHIPQEYIDVQCQISQYFNIPKKTKLSLKNTIELLNVNIEGDFHNAFNDAYYTTEIFKRIYNNKIVPLTYNFNPPKRKISTRDKVDIEGLLNQFEKIYNRKLSKDEIDMIKLAYTMGRTRQFIK